jgi:hypothetical protein
MWFIQYLEERDKAEENFPAWLKKVRMQYAKAYMKRFNNMVQLRKDMKKEHDLYRVKRRVITSDFSERKSSDNVPNTPDTPVNSPND